MPSDLASYYTNEQQTTGLALEEIDTVFGKEVVAHLADMSLEKATISGDEDMSKA